MIQAGQAEGSVLVEAEAAGARYNVSEDQIRVSMIYLEGVSQVTNRQGWIYSEGQMKRAKPAYAAGPVSSWEELVHQYHIGQAGRQPWRPSGV